MPVLRPYIKHVERVRKQVKTREAPVAVPTAEKEKILRMLAVLENEKKEGIVTDRAYNEMKKNLEAKLARTEKK